MAASAAATTSESTLRSRTAYGRMDVIRCCARFSRAAATIFMARVIFCVFLTLPMRLRRLLRSATFASTLRSDEAFGERLQCRLEGRLEVVRDCLLLTQRLPD